ncbi:serine/threonine-protein kinase pim-3 [Labeo rohita]|uniref:serine/threonine-protein kinase pim-3 n=1 Tax=Labeo rohita TaxID=84645 RepID=UPI0021E33FCF|nr:serine/threonine-protein kinase pim-3 [Labeo rohita]
MGQTLTGQHMILTSTPLNTFGMNCNGDCREVNSDLTEDPSLDVPNSGYLKTPVHVIPDLSADVSLAIVCSTDVPGADVPQTTVCAADVPSDDVPQATVCATDVLNADIPEATVCATSDGVPTAFFSATSNCSDDATAGFFSSMSDYRVRQAPVRAAAVCRVKVPRATVCAVPDSTVYVPQALIRPTADCSADVPQASVCQTQDTVSSLLSDLEDNDTLIIDISGCSYEISSQLGEGGFGTVYAATRLDDGFQVAVKIASKRNTKFISIDGYSKPLPLEVALQILANQGPRVPEIIQLLDWQMERDHYVIVLERPMPCQSLYEFMESYKGSIKEDMARAIMRQATHAAQTCCQRGVFHRDIKLENLLINPDTLEVKLIDFGCGAILTSEGYTSFAGTDDYYPPEYLFIGKYHGKPATVWSLGIILFAMLTWKFPKRRDLRLINDKIWTKHGLSQECHDFISCCLQIDPKQRIELEKLSLHNWFKA